MSSFRSLAIVRRNKGAFRLYNNQNRFLQAVLEIAHALSRGRKPTSCSVLPGVNLQKWLHNVFIDITPGYYDYTGKECSKARDVIDWYQGWGQEAIDGPTILRAIKLCRRYMRPVRRDSEFRGDFQYQNTHRVTNLKKKRAWLRNKNGSHYDDIHDYFDPVEEYDLNIDMDHMPNKVESSNDADATLETAISPDAQEPPLVPRVRRIRHVSS